MLDISNRFEWGSKEEEEEAAVEESNCYYFWHAKLSAIIRWWKEERFQHKSLFLNVNCKVHFISTTFCHERFVCR